MEVNEGIAACVVLSDFAKAISSAPASCQKPAVASVMITTIKLKETNLRNIAIVMIQNSTPACNLLKVNFIITNLSNSCQYKIGSLIHLLCYLFAFISFLCRRSNLEELPSIPKSGSD